MCATRSTAKEEGRRIEDELLNESEKDCILDEEEMNGDEDDEDAPEEDDRVRICCCDAVTSKRMNPLSG